MTKNEIAEEVLLELAVVALRRRDYSTVEHAMPLLRGLEQRILDEQSLGEADQYAHQKPKPTSSAPQVVYKNNAENVLDDAEDMQQDTEERDEQHDLPAPPETSPSPTQSLAIKQRNTAPPPRSR